MAGKKDGQRMAVANGSRIAMSWADDLAKEFTAETNPPKGAFTIYDLMTKLPGISRSSLESKMNRKVEMGQYKKGKFICKSKQTNFYWK